MEPMGEFEILIDQIGKEKCHIFTCDHIIPDENFAAYTIS